MRLNDPRGFSSMRRLVWIVVALVIIAAPITAHGDFNGINEPTLVEDFESFDVGDQIGDGRLLNMAGFWLGPLTGGDNPHNNPSRVRDMDPGTPDPSNPFCECASGPDAGPFPFPSKALELIKSGAAAGAILRLDPQNFLTGPIIEISFDIWHTQPEGAVFIDVIGYREAAEGEGVANRMLIGNPADDENTVDKIHWTCCGFGHPIDHLRPDGGQDFDWHHDVFQHVIMTIDLGSTPQSYTATIDGVNVFDEVAGFTNPVGRITDIRGINFEAAGFQQRSPSLQGTNLYLDNISIGNVTGSLACDFDTSGSCNEVDINLLRTAIQMGTSNPIFNVDGIGGGVPDDADFDFYITDDSMLGTGHGDADLNLIVNFVDFVSLSNDFGMTGTGWEKGNFNTDDNTNFNDFVALSNNFGQNFASGSDVPEPIAAVLLGLGGLALAWRKM